MKRLKFLFIIIAALASLTIHAQVDPTIDKGSGWLYFSGIPGTTPNVATGSEAAINLTTREAYVWNRDSSAWEKWLLIDSVAYASDTLSIWQNGSATPIFAVIPSGTIDTAYLSGDTLGIVFAGDTTEVVLAGLGDGNGLFDASNDLDTIRVSTALLRAGLNITGGANGMTVTRNSASPTMTLQNSSSGLGLSISSTLGSALQVQGDGGTFAADIRIGAAATNATSPALRVTAVSSTGLMTTGGGGAIEFYNETDAAGFSVKKAAQLSAVIRDGLPASFSNAFEVQVSQNDTMKTRLKLEPTGQLTLPGYAASTLNNVDSSLYVLAVDATGDVWSIPVDSLGGGGGSQTLSTSNDSLTISGGNTVRVPGTGYVRDSVTTTTLTVDLANHNNAIVVLKMETATNLTLTINNPWSAVSGSYPNQSGETGTYSFHFRGVAGTDNVTWPAAFVDMTGAALGTDALVDDTLYTCFYDPAELKYYCK